MRVEELAVVLGCLICCVERSKVTWRLYHAVREPLVPSSGEECVAKVIVVVKIAGGAAFGANRGRTTLQQKKKAFDPTKGYPGDDIQI